MVCVLLEIPWRISMETKIYNKIYHAWAQPMHGRFLKMNRESRFERGHRPKIKIQGSSCWNICRRRDPKCYFDLIPKRKIKNQWKKLETKIPHGVFHWNTPWITGYFSFDFILLKIPIKLIMCFNYFSPLLGVMIDTLLNIPDNLSLSWWNTDTMHAMHNRIFLGLTWSC